MANPNATNHSIARITSLKYTATWKLIVYLWTNANIMNAILDGSWKFYAMNASFIPNNNFDNLVDSIRRKLHILLLDGLLVKEVDYLVIPLGLEICSWIDENRNFISLYRITEFLNSIQWTFDGYIHKNASIELWVEKTEFVINFKRACYYCVEPQIIRLWDRMPEFARHYYRNVSERDIVLTYWVHKLHKTMDEFLLILKRYSRDLLNSTNSDEFQLPLNENDFEIETVEVVMVWFSITNSNCSAVAYFLSQSGSQMRSNLANECMEAALYYESISRGILNFQPVDIVFHLYVNMNIVDRMLFEQSYINVFFSLMINYCKYRSRIVPAIETLGHVLRSDMYSELVEKIFIGVETKRFLRKCLLKRMWNASPSILKSGFYQHVFSNVHMLHIFKEETFYISNVLLIDTNAPTKNELLSFFEI